jgi:hypothetical protein
MNNVRRPRRPVLATLLVAATPLLAVAGAALSTPTAASAHPTTVALGQPDCFTGGSALNQPKFPSCLSD